MKMKYLLGIGMLLILIVPVEANDDDPTFTCEWDSNNETLECDGIVDAEGSSVVCSNFNNNSLWYTEMRDYRNLWKECIIAPPPAEDCEPTNSKILNSELYIGVKNELDDVLDEKAKCEDDLDECEHATISDTQYFQCTTDLQKCEEQKGNVWQTYGIGAAIMFILLAFANKNPRDFFGGKEPKHDVEAEYGEGTW